MGSGVIGEWCWCGFVVVFLGNLSANMWGFGGCLVIIVDVCSGWDMWAEVGVVRRCGGGMVF